MANMKKLKSLVSLLLIASMIFSVVFLSTILSAKDVSAAQVCCEKTKSGDFCSYVDESECAGLKAPTTCDQTNFCKPGCCFDKQGDGFCYANYAKALCTSGEGGVFSDDASCTSVNECSLGCCIIGNQALYTTEIKCKSEVATYPDLKMDFRSNVGSEAECLNIARADEWGACVSEDASCKWTTRGTCAVADAVSNSDNSTGVPVGFHKDKYCSSIGGVNCAPANPAIRGGSGNAKSTMCLDTDDSVYWQDSCGNPEGIKQKCDYNSGTLCGDSDGNGEYTCESVDCQSTRLNNDLSVNLEDFFGTDSVSDNGILNGESWCFYDRAAVDA